MDYWGILKRSFEITWKHKPLWLFGFLQGLFNAGGNFRVPSFGPSSTPSGFERAPRISPQLERFFEQLFTPFFIIILILVSLIFIFLVIFVTYLSQAALIGMVFEIENQEKTSLRSGFKQGFSSWLKLLGISFVVWFPYLIGILVVAGIFALPAVLSFLAKKIALGIIFSVLGVLIWIGLLILTAIPLFLITNFAFRFRVIEHAGVFKSIREGYRIFRENLGKILLMWLIMLVVGMVVGVVFFIVAILVVLPVFLLLSISLWLVIPFAIPAFLGIAFLSGLVQVFTSSVWTLTFLSLRPRPQV